MKIFKLIINSIATVFFGSRTAKNSLEMYYMQYDQFVRDDMAMHDALNQLVENSPIHMVIKAHGDAKAYQRKAIEGIKRCLKLAPSEAERERLILELDRIQSYH